MRRTARWRRAILGLGLALGLTAAGPLACGDDSNNNNNNNQPPASDEDTGMDDGDGDMDAGPTDTDDGPDEDTDDGPADDTDDGPDEDTTTGDEDTTTGDEVGVQDGGMDGGMGGDDTGDTATATVQFIHNSPDPAASKVDVWARIGADANNDFTPAVNNLEFREATPGIEVPAGEEIDITLAGPDSSSDGSLGNNEGIKTWENLTFSADTTSVVVVNGLVNEGDFETSKKLSATTLTDVQTSPTGSSTIDAYAVHGAPDAPAVDIAPGNQLGTNNAIATGVQYGAATNSAAQLTGTPGVVDIGTQVNNSVEFVTNFQADASSLGGTVYTVVASGFYTPGGDDQTNGSDGEPLRFVAFPISGIDSVPASGLPVDGTSNNQTTAGTPLPTAARAQLIHASAASAYSTVDVAVAGTTVAQGVGFSEATGFLSLPTGTSLPATISDPSGNAPALNPDIPAIPGTGDATVATKTVLVRGGNGGTSPGLAVANARESKPGKPAAPSGELAINAVHAAPAAPSPVDVSVFDTSGGSDTELVPATEVALDNASGIVEIQQTTSGYVRVAAPDGNGGTINLDFDLTTLSNASFSATNRFATFFAADNTDTGAAAPVKIFAVTEAGSTVELAFINQ